MPLSEHEQRLLEQIEQALYAEDPKFARNWRAKNLKNRQRMHLLRAASLFVIGLGVLLAGVITQIIPLGVGGFVLMVAGASLAIAGTRFSGREAAAAKPTPARGPRQSLLARLEERWQRRQDNR